MRNLKNKIVKKIAALALAVAGVGFAASQTYADDAIGSAQVAADYQPRSMADLEQLTAPVALYPDALLAQVLAASTYPDDVVAAAQYLRNGGDPGQVGTNGWDASVQGLMQAPEALNKLAANVDWMNQLGSAFINQQQDVMNAVQVVRQQARAAGNLVSTPQQEVVIADNCVQIVPANPQIIYVPVYDPGIVFLRRGGFGSCITFCPGIRVGLWLHDDFDWCDHRIYFGNWGFNRPWWHHAGGRVGFDYIHNHPGIYVTNARSRATTWVHSFNRPGPVHARVSEIRRVAQSNFRTANLPSRGTRSFNRGGSGGGNRGPSNVTHRGGTSAGHSSGGGHATGGHRR